MSKKKRNQRSKCWLLLVHVSLQPHVIEHSDGSKNAWDLDSGGFMGTVVMTHQGWKYPAVIYHHSCVKLPISLMISIDLLNMDNDKWWLFLVLVNYKKAIWIVLCNAGKAINHPPNHHGDMKYGDYSQSWVVYGIVLYSITQIISYPNSIYIYIYTDH